MPFLEALKLAISAILAHKLRSFLTLLGVIFGVAKWKMRNGKSSF
jgi:putative ABC transport system permease protein